MRILIPNSINHAVDRFAEKVSECGYKAAYLSTYNGEPTSLDLFDKNGEQHFYIREDDGWRVFDRDSKDKSHEQEG